MTDRFFNALGICRRAGKLTIGHDEVKNSVRSKNAQLIILTADASERLVNEMLNLTSDIKIIRTDATMADMQLHIGKRSAVYAITDSGLKDLVLSTIKED
ncbi:MAG: ribosomal L7Ae/L30e/S12e/Gadd45 family protein [Clostridia bacterium]|nr:ribosomal L7Ae/L30e/S12e/Gadd45 family protein [Clostridia bacterium]